MKKLVLSTLLVAQLSFNSALAFQPFVIKNIRVEGIQRVSEEAVLQDIPIEVGQKFTEALSSQAIKQLFETGFFKDVKLIKEGNTLVVRVVERATISKLDLTGVRNKEPIEKILKEQQLIEGRMYDPALVRKVEKAIEYYYLTQARYGVKVESTVTEDGENKVALKVEVFEGDVAKIKAINFVGNHAFTSKVLAKQLLHKKQSFFSWMNKADQYSKEKFEADLELLRTFYLNHGYINFQVDSTQVSLSVDKKSVYLTINITEGIQYFFDEVKVSGDFASVPESELQAIIDEHIKPQQMFSIQSLNKVKEELEGKFGETGYSKTQVRMREELDDEKQTINLDYHIDTGKRVSVRRIQFAGNTLTQDDILRRKVEQLEGTWISTKAVKEGKEAIQRVGYGTEVQTEISPVMDRDDQVDVLYKMEEQKTAQLSAGISYSKSERFAFNLGSDFKNFLGTGRDVGLNFSNSPSQTVYSMSYYNPFFTESGIGMGYNLYKQKRELSKTSKIFEYVLNSTGAELHWQFRVSYYNSLRLGVSFDSSQLLLDTASAATPQEARRFAEHYSHRERFYEYAVSGAWMHNSLDQYIFPTKGLNQTLNFKLATPLSCLKWYRIDYSASWFKPIYKGLVFNLQGQIGFGNGYDSTIYPFYKFYFLGGVDGVRGFEERSLGPKDSLGKPIGGNAVVFGRAQFLMRPPFFKDAKNVRTALFFDAGQVYTTNDKRDLTESASRNPNGLRFSVGASLTWNSPMVPIMFGIATPLNRQEGDSIRRIFFTLGTQM